MDMNVSKGKDVVYLDPGKEKPDRAALLRLLLRPTGDLRTPTLRKGRTLLIGFDEATYTKVLG